MPWPGGGADINMRPIDPNPATYANSPYFFPVLSEDDGLDYIRGVLFEEHVRLWMGEYFPIVHYCTKEKFEHNSVLLAPRKRNPSGRRAAQPTPTRRADQIFTEQPQKRETVGLQRVSDAGGGTRTPDTRIMIPLL
jgi:hypothetical protein